MSPRPCLTALPHGSDGVDDIDGSRRADRVGAEARVATDGLVAKAVSVKHGRGAERVGGRVCEGDAGFTRPPSCAHPRPALTDGGIAPFVAERVGPGRRVGARDRAVGVHLVLEAYPDGGLVDARAGVRRVGVRVEANAVAFHLRDSLEDCSTGTATAAAR